MAKVTLTKIYKTNKDKEGNELKSKKGFPYTRMSIKTEEHGDKWVSGFENKDNKDWKEGDTVEIEVKENGQYLNFETPKQDEVSVKQMGDVLNKLVTIKMQNEQIVDFLKALSKHFNIKNPESVDVSPQNAMGVEVDEIDEIPF